MYFLVCGFLFSYLITRVFLAGAFSRSDSISEKISKLVNLNLELGELTEKEKEILNIFFSKEEQGQPYKLDTSFIRESPEHNALRSLRDKYIIQPCEGGKWKVGKIVKLTPLAEKIKEQIKTIIQNVNNG